MGFDFNKNNITPTVDGGEPGPGPDPGPTTTTIDPLEYSTGLFFNIDCQETQTLGINKTYDIPNLAGGTINYLKPTTNTLNAVTENGFILDGTFGWYQYGASAPLRCNMPTFTAEIVFQTSNPNQTSYMLGNIQGGGIGIALTEGEYVMGAIYDGTSYIYPQSEAGSIQANQTYYAAIRYDGDNFSLFLNPTDGTAVTNQQLGEIPISTLGLQNAPMALGYNPSTNGEFGGQGFTGTIYSAKIWSCAKSNDFISKSYQIQKERFGF